MDKVYASLIRKGILTLDDIKDEKMKEAVSKILKEVQAYGKAQTFFNEYFINQKGGSHYGKSLCFFND